MNGFIFGDEWKSNMMKALVNAMRWNKYFGNWPIVLNALRRLWEIGKVSEMKTPFYEPFEKTIYK